MLRLVSSLFWGSRTWGEKVFGGAVDRNGLRAQRSQLLDDIGDRQAGAVLDVVSDGQGGGHPRPQGATVLKGEKRTPPKTSSGVQGRRFAVERSLGNPLEKRRAPRLRGAPLIFVLQAEQDLQAFNDRLLMFLKEWPDDISDYLVQ